MLLTRNYSKLLTAICLLHIAGQALCLYIVPYSVTTTSNDFESCEDTSALIYQLKQSSGFEAFKQITQPLSELTVPPQIQEIYNRLLLAVQSGQLNIDNVIAQLGNIAIHNKFDLLIATLMVINENATVEHNLTVDLNQIIYYLLRKRYLGRNDFILEQEFIYNIPSTVLEELPLLNINTQSTDCSRTVSYLSYLVQMILNKMQQLQFGSVQSQPVYIVPNSPSRLPDLQPPPVQFTIEDLITLIPKPKFDAEMQMYQKFVALLKSAEVQQILKTMDTTKYKTKQEILDVLLVTITTTITRTEVTEIVNYYMTYKEAAAVGFNYANLISVLPAPTTPTETNYYTIIKTLFTSKQIYSLTQNLHLQLGANVNLQDILIEVLKYLSSSQEVAPTVLEAVHYYLAVSAGQHYNLDLPGLIILLPKPTTPEDTAQFNILKSILASNEIYVLLQNVNDLVSISDKQELLRRLLVILASNSANQSLSAAARYYIRVEEVSKFGFDSFNLLTLLQLPEENRSYLTVLENYMYTLEFENIVSKLNLRTLPDSDKLFAILNALATSATDQQIVTACQQILAILYHQQFSTEVQRILLILPQPQTEDEKQKLLIITQFLNSDQGYQLLHNEDYSLFPDDKLVIEQMFKIIMQSQVEASVMEAVKYYYDVIEKLEEVDFVTRKEIQKHFKLHEIFSDALNIHGFNFQQKQAFIAFYKYISKVNPQAISGFDSWDKATSRGQFAKLMFDYLLNQQQVPPDIKNNVLVLVPLVQMAGNAALPP